MAPYIITHLRMGLLLQEDTDLPFEFGDDDRLNVFLTNSLELPNDRGLLFSTQMKDMFSDETNNADVVKRDTAITVVLGNPPYSGESSNKGDYIMGLMESYKKEPGGIVKLNDNLSVTPFIVPHRDEYSETVGFKVSGLTYKLIFIPDIDKWDKWGQNIREVIKDNDCVLIDGTFFGRGEIPNRNMAEIPHPSIEESMDYFSVLSVEDKSKVHFIHLNHTNPALDSTTVQWKTVINLGFNISFMGQRFPL